MTKPLIAHCRVKNWGDALNIPMFNFLAQQECEFYSYGGEKPRPHILGIGSILAHARKTSTVWGSGFIRHNDRIAETPAKILAVRGPHSRKKVLRQHIECPEVYGDPALLYPLVYKPRQRVRYKWGFIPHYVDYENPFFKSCKRDDCLLINVNDPTNTVVDQLAQCEFIASSSLHGLIAADAYKKKSVWMRLSEKIVGRGYKFQDYFASVGRNQEVAIVCENETLKAMENALYGRLSSGKIDLDLNPLLDCCPVITDESFRAQLKKDLSQYYAT